MARKEKDAPEAAEGDIDSNHAELRVYELGFHIDAELPSEEVKKTFETIRSLIVKTGTVVAEGAPQKMQLAYTISRSDTAGRRDFDTAHFAWIAYETNGAGHDTVLEAAGLEKRIIRFIDVRTTKEEAQHSAEVQEMAAKMAPVEGGDDDTAVSDAELSTAIEGAVV